MRPTPPQPQTATTSPRWMLQKSAPMKPVGAASEMNKASSSETPSGTTKQSVFANGTRTYSACAPDVVESRTFRITWFGLRISGSATVSTRRSLTPFQQSARIVFLLAVGAAVAGSRLGIGCRDLAGEGQSAEFVERLQHDLAR